MPALPYIQPNLTLGPEELRVVTTAFEQAWNELQSGVPKNDAEATRLRLAGIVISLTKQGISDHRMLQSLAVMLMRRPLKWAVTRKPSGPMDGAAHAMSCQSDARDEGRLKTKVDLT